jgi:lipopolysaccharide/colanic/teichoic acid biosynthesis glycosyltransferase
VSTANSSTLLRKPHRVVAAPAWRSQVADILSPPPYFRWKAILDRAVAALLLLPGLPMIGCLVLLVRLTSRGPGMYRQVRIGQRGRKFTIYKIRTMRHDAEAASGPVWTQARDPRITRVGRVLRRLHLDELPQLFNILRGEMSLIGPRPERPEFVHVLTEAIPGYLNRLAIRPGVTGLAQLNLPPDTDLDSVRRKLALDCEYIQRAGLLLDIRLFACTALRMLRLPERWLLRILGLKRKVTIPTAPEGHSPGGANGAAHAPATPADVLIQAAGTSTKSDGNAHRREKRSRKRFPGGNSRPKPR